MIHSTFVPLDWMVLFGYFAVLLFTGIKLSKPHGGMREYFLSDGRIPVWAAAISTLATALSAATFLGCPQITFREGGNLTYLSANIGAIIGALIAAFVFIPAYYREGVTTVYEFVGRRYGGLGAGATSAAFLVGRILAGGARVYMAALPASLILFGDISGPHMVGAIAVLSAVAALYTLGGGVTSVIWTDCIQAVIFIDAGVVALCLLLHFIPLDISEILKVLREAGKLEIFRAGASLSPPSIDFQADYTLLTACTGLALLNLAAYATDHDLAQRLLTCSSPAKGGMAVMGAILIGIPAVALFMCVGLLLYIYYGRPDIMGAAAPAVLVGDSRKIFLAFIMDEIPAGVRGFMLAGLFASALSTLNSSLNSMSAALINDFYLRWRPKAPDHQLLRASKICVVACAVVLGAVGILCWRWNTLNADSLINFALTVMGFAYSGLAAVFLAAVTSKRGRGGSAAAAVLTGFGVAFCLEPGTLNWLSMTILGHTLSFSPPAFPWRMLTATAAAYIVCILPPGVSGGEARPAQGQA
ncbi:MAG: sodium:solute symporter [Planctomycetes bacterium]|nr:sodium:solute symporter [Planctomycetota bacterium]